MRHDHAHQLETDSTSGAKLYVGASDTIYLLSASDTVSTLPKYYRNVPSGCGCECFLMIWTRSPRLRLTCRNHSTTVTENYINFVVQHAEIHVLINWSWSNFNIQVQLDTLSECGLRDYVCWVEHRSHDTHMWSSLRILLCSIFCDIHFISHLITFVVVHIVKYHPLEIYIVHITGNPLYLTLLDVVVVHKVVNPLNLTLLGYTFKDIKGNTVTQWNIFHASAS